MNRLSLAAALALSLASAACGESPSGSPDNRGSLRDAVYSASGTVTEISGDQITISHGPVEGLGWPAMTMTFRARSPNMVQGISAGDRVVFEFREVDAGYTVTSLNKAQ